MCVFALIPSLHWSNINAETALTTIAILAMVTHPANVIMTIVPRTVTSFSSFKIVQDHLLEPVCSDPRQEIIPLQRAQRTEDGILHLSSVIVSGRSESAPLLKNNITLKLRGSYSTVLAGMIGSGKSILPRTILGRCHLQWDHHDGI